MSTATKDEAHVAEVIDLSESTPGTSTLPFALTTGRFAVAFTVNGRIIVTALPGEQLLPFAPETQSAPLAAIIREPGSHVLVSSDAAGFAAGLGADGSLWTKSVDRERPTSRREGWRQTAPAAGGPVTAVRTTEGRSELLAVAAEGAALRLVDGGWRELGGERFRGALVALPRDGDGVDLFGVTTDGEVAHRSLGAREEGGG